LSLELELHHHYPGFTLDLSLNWHAEGICALFGPSGCGKSTLLRLIAGIEQPGRGYVRFQDQLWQDSDRGIWTPPQQRDIGVVFQDGRLFPNMTVADNLAFADAYPRRGPELERDWVIETLQLPPLLQRSPETLSGGQRQRAALARALFSRPRLLLMDEPLSALDLRSRQLILELIRQLHDRHRLPMLYVTHSADEVLRLADQLICLQQGRISAQGLPAELLGRPESGLPDDQALLPGQVTAIDTEYGLAAVSCSANAAPVWIPARGLTIGSHLNLCLQARDIALSRHPVTGTSLQNQLPVVIDSLQPLDSASMRVDVCFGTCRLPVILTRRACAELELTPGLEVIALIKSVAVEH